MSMSTITVAGINPILKILGAAQQFNYDQSLSTFQLNNSFTPVVGIPSQFNQEFRNNLLSGFRWTHLTTTTDTYGSFTLQSFVNALNTGTDLMRFSNTGIDLYNDINLNNNKITNSAAPIAGGDIATKNYVDTRTITLSGAVTGSGALGSTIATTLTNITTSQITNFNSAVTAFRLDQFAAPTASLNLNSQKITNLAPPTVSTDATNKDYVDTAIGSFVLSVSGTVGKISSTGGQNPIINLVPTAVTPGSYTNMNATVDEDGRITAASNGITGAVASLYMSGNTTPTTITTADTYTKILGTTTATVTGDFTAPTDNKFVYTGTNSLSTFVRADVSAIPDAISTVSISIFQNNAQVLAANYNYQATAAQRTALTVGVPVQFSTNDFVEVFVTYDTTGDIAVKDMNFQVII
jgi:hypothetical protein